MSTSRVVPDIAPDQPGACRDFYAGLRGRQAVLAERLLLSRQDR